MLITTDCAGRYLSQASGRRVKGDCSSAKRWLFTLPGYLQRGIKKLPGNVSREGACH